MVAAPDAKDNPSDWCHYISAKYAIEGLVRALADEAKRASFLIIRPPRLLTDQTNTTNARQDALPVEDAAAAIVRRLCETGSESRLEIVDLA